MRQKVKFLWAITLFALFAVLSVCGQGIVSVQGRVIDEHGKPIANAKVGLEYPPCKACLDHIIETMTTPSDGYFYQDTSNIIGVMDVRLIIEEEVSPVSFRLIHYPVLALSHLRQYRGIAIENRTARDINLGDVLPTIRYKEFSVDLSKYITDTKDFFEMRFSVRDYLKKKVVANDRTIPKSFWKNDSTVNIALPKDKWIIDVQYRKNNGGTTNKSFLVDAICNQDESIKITPL